MQQKLETRIIAFIDILGFKNLWEYNQQLTIAVLKEISNSNAPSEFFEEIEVFSYSDNIIILSSPLKDKTITQISRILSALMARIESFHIYNLQHGVVLRGAISIGEVYQDTENLSKIIAGTPFNEAVEGEKYLAIYPRVILTKSLLNYIAALPYSERYALFYSGIKMDFDGIFFVDYLLTLTRASSEDNDAKYKLLLNIQSMIKNELLSQVNEIKISTKWYWLANYFDEKIEEWNAVNAQRILKKFNLCNSYIEQSFYNSQT